MFDVTHWEILIICWNTYISQGIKTKVSLSKGFKAKQEKLYYSQKGAYAGANCQNKGYPTF